VSIASEGRVAGGSALGGGSATSVALGLGGLEGAALAGAALAGAALAGAALSGGVVLAAPELMLFGSLHATASNTVIAARVLLRIIVAARVLI
jgi:hypothetical protein